jgi:cysteine desulfurase family protein (TIGR01976 family)
LQAKSQDTPQADIHPQPNLNFPIETIRSFFPALDRPPAFTFFDNAAGAQIPQIVFDAVNRHLLECNVQRGGRYAKSLEVDATIARARQSVADFLNARDPSEIAFGINVATWLALEKEGAKLVWWKMGEDGNLHVDDLKPLVSSKTRLVACAVAANSLGSIVDVAEAAKIAHNVGAEVFLDCVHFGPHGQMDVQAFDCDYLVCSGYKIFGPHMGFLWGRRELLQKLPTFREEFIPDEPPGKIEAGTFIYENVAGMDAAISYLESLGKRPQSGGDAGTKNSKRANLARAMQNIRAYEESLSREMLHVLQECGATVYGLAGKNQVHERVPTLCFNLPNLAPRKVTESLAQAGIGIRDGHMYAPRLMKRLGVPMESGVVRASLVHYNTLAEIHSFGNALLDLTKHG